MALVFPQGKALPKGGISDTNNPAFANEKDLSTLFIPHCRPGVSPCPIRISLRKQRRFCQIRNEAARAGPAKGRAPSFRSDRLEARDVTFRLEVEYRDHRVLGWRAGWGK